MLHFSHEEFKARLTRLKTSMAERNLDAMLLFSQESMYWLTGYDTFGFCFFQSLVVKANGEMVLLTRSADLRQAQHTSILENIEIWRDSVDAIPVARLQEVLNDLGLAGVRLGVEYDTHGLTASNGRKLDATLTDFARLEDASNIIPDLRLTKSTAELDHVRKAATLADEVLDAAIATTRSGAWEGDILAAMHRANYHGGGDNPANEFILGSDRDALLCRNKSGRRNLSADDQLTIEYAGVFAHYHVAMMDTLVIGQPRSRHVQLFEAARAALQGVQAAMVCGNNFGDLYEAHARVMDDAGLSAHRLNACGYSLGARFAPSWMDGPMFYAGNKQTIEPNMVLFAHMIIVDSESETAMTSGRTFVTGEHQLEILSRHDLDLITV